MLKLLQKVHHVCKFKLRHVSPKSTDQFWLNLSSAEQNNNTVIFFYTYILTKITSLFINKLKITSLSKIIAYR